MHIISRKHITATLSDLQSEAPIGVCTTITGAIPAILQPFEAGILNAESFNHCKLWAKHTIGTAGIAAKLNLKADFCGLALKADGGVIIYIYATLTH